MKTSPTTEPEIAYVLKAFGRTSETFITNEIHLLENLGMKLTIFSIKKLESQRQHGVISRIVSPVSFLPEAEPVNTTGFLTWLCLTLPRFALVHLKLFSLRPLSYLLTLAEALRFCVRYRSRRFVPKKVFVKEFLQAGYIALQVLQSGTIRHLHAHFCHGATTVTMFASRLSGLPFSFTAHAKDIYLSELNPRDLLPLKMRRAEFVATCTGANHQHLKAFCTQNTPLHTIYHGLDTSLFEPASTTGGDEQQVPLILSVGRIVEKKGFDYLLRACHLLRQQGREFKCLIVGGADKFSENIARLISELQLESVVTVQSSVTQEELKSIYQQATVFALPCLVTDNGDRDGIPNVMVEAMAMKLPVVSTDISGIPELVQSGVNGLLVPPKDETALAAAIATLLDDAGLRQQLGNAARTRVLQSFDSKRNTVFLKNLFAECLNVQTASATSAAKSEVAIR
ncbi:MAG: glycosyltransferase [Acidobacteriota bacterium]|nr:glycosyltransferase [Acidobacteriota bacterium]